MQVLCEKGHSIMCEPHMIPKVCPHCGSARLTYVAGELKEPKKGMFSRKSNVTQVTFSREGRMEELDRKYGRR